MSGEETPIRMTTALILTSNSARHIYFVNAMARTFEVRGIISEPKAGYFEQQLDASALVREHFANLAKYEKQYLGAFASFPEAPTLFIDKKGINEASTIAWARQHAADVVLLFGTGILSDEWLASHDRRIVNLHLGYSPRYRGSATLFWPFANDELDFVGATIHVAERKVDAGAILQIVTPDIMEHDHYYDISNKTIKKAIDAMPGVVNAYLENRLPPVVQDAAQQKFCYRKKDFTEAVLRRVLDKYGH